MFSLQTFTREHETVKTYHFNVFLLGKISLKEIEQTSLENLNAYLDKQKLTKPRMRSHSSQQVWLWHDDDELLQYEGLLEDYHDR